MSNRYRGSHVQEYLRVVDASKLEQGIMKVLFVGTYRECIGFLRRFKGKDVDFIGLDGNFAA